MADTNFNLSQSKIGKLLGLVGLSLVAGALGAWLFLASGWIKLDDAISQNREKIVLQQGEIVADVFTKVDPSTVSITTKAVTTTNSLFFGTQKQVVEAAGSGIIVSKDGYVLTNRHVVPDGTQSVTVILGDGTEYKNVKVVGRDPSNDLAFLKIAGVSNLKPAVIGDSSQVKPGQQVVAIGNALGIFRNSVSSGIISGIGRPLVASDGQGSSENLDNLIQTDAAINHGNSGGPLVNLKGEVIGINTAVAEQGDAIGFAIPINDAKGLLKTVLATGKVVKPYLGVRYISLNANVADQLNLSVKEGALVRGSDSAPGVAVDSPASKAGLKEGDIITKVGDQAVTPTSGLSSLLAAHSVGDRVELTLLRDGKEVKLTVTLEAFPQ